MKIINIYLLFFSSILHAQTYFHYKYDSLCEKAGELYNSGKYKLSASNYIKAIDFAEHTPVLRNRENISFNWLNLAGCYSMQNYIDSSFFCFNKVINDNGLTLDFLIYLKNGFPDKKDYLPLHKDKRWLILMNELDKKITIAEKKLNKSFIETIHKTHLNYLKFFPTQDSIIKKFGKSSLQYKDFLKKYSKSDSLNLIPIKKIIDSCGWLGADVLGTEGNDELFLIIQHSDLLTQTKYLPLLRSAALSGKADLEQLALMEDRVAVGNGKKQLYGTQLKTDSSGKHILEAIEDEANLNFRRANMGMEPIENYLKHFGIVYRFSADSAAQIIQKSGIKKNETSIISSFIKWILAGSIGLISLLVIWYYLKQKN